MEPFPAGLVWQAVKNIALTGKLACECHPPPDQAGNNENSPFGKGLGVCLFIFTRRQALPAHSQYRPMAPAPEAVARGDGHAPGMAGDRSASQGHL